MIQWYLVVPRTSSSMIWRIFFTTITNVVTTPSMANTRLWNNIKIAIVEKIVAMIISVIVEYQVSNTLLFTCIKLLLVERMNSSLEMKVEKTVILFYLATRF